ncbi:MAG: hypothetical protein JSR82_22695 [Verrucomicrobia bacterium]|nr:hypothetical protein [Verrucomicrobiota bacterium]
MKPFRPSIELQRQRYEARLAWRTAPASTLAGTGAESELPLPEPPAASLAEVERLLQRISERRARLLTASGEEAGGLLREENCSETLRVVASDAADPEVRCLALCELMRRCALGDSAAQLHFWMLEQPSEEYTPTYSAAPPR